MVGKFKALEWRAGTVVMLDQRYLPQEEIYNTYKTADEIAEAIRSMVIRGAPAIACAAAMGVALSATTVASAGRDAVVKAVESSLEVLRQTRPTAVNLFWALARAQKIVSNHPDATGFELAEALRLDALEIVKEDAEANRRMGFFGAELLPDKDELTILTHCNTGALATGGYGTALGVIRAAVEQGRKVHVFADETRPWLQGARLTAWELQRDEIDVTVIPDSQAGALMKMGLIDAAVVGSDRIAANGDVANKIGTYSVAVLCHYHGLPFYVAAPTSTVDLETSTGDDIPLEERPAEEITTIGGTRFVPENVSVKNIAFDVTPAELVTALITEVGVAHPPYRSSLKNLIKSSKLDS